MSVIQDIRDKYARWAVIAIAVALLGFILMDALAGRGSIFGNRNTNVGKINGKSIDYQQFAFKVQDYEKRLGPQAGENRTEQAVNDVWNQEVGTTLLSAEFEKLGLGVSDKELRDILYGANPPEDLRQGFTDPNTGVYNAVQAQQQISQISKSGSPEQKQQLQDYLGVLENQRLMEKYNALLMGAVYIPKWFIEKQNVDNGLVATVSYVSVPYSSIADSTVKISDGEIENYMKAHQKDFEQKEESRSLNYVMFSAAPNAKDSAAALAKAEALKQQLDTATQYEDLIQRSGSQMGFYDSYIAAKNIQNPLKDSILAAPVGAVAGPFADNNVYEISKIISQRNLPDTVKVRHILISTHQANPQTGEMMQVRDDSVAKHLVDSVQGLLNAGQPFDSLVVKFSEDPGSKSTGGVYENVFTGQMVAPFNDFIFTNPVGSRGIVKTNYGYHLVEVLEQKGSSPAYKIAYLTVPIETSQETDNNANNDANMFAGSANNVKSFDETWEKEWRSKGVNKLAAVDIRPLDYSMQGLNGNARSLIRKVFDADKGDVIGPERVGENYIVAVVTDVEKPGLPSVARVRPMVEPVLRNRKKAEQIKKQMGQAADLNQVAQKFNQQVQTVDSVTFAGRNHALAFEQKVVGAAFNPANKDKVSEPIEGQSGVYVIKATNVRTQPVAAADIAGQRQALEMQAKQSLRSPIEALQKAADIKDNRAEFY